MSGLITGRVVDAHGHPVAGATVAVTSATEPVSDVAAVTDTAGQFRRSGLAPGAYTLEVRKAGQPPRTVEVEVAVDQQVNLEIRIGEPVVQPENSGVLAVELQPESIDWSRVRLVRVALDYPGSGGDEAVGRDFILTPSNHDVSTWEVPVSDTNHSTYTYEIEYFLANGSRRRVRSEETSEQTLVLDPFG